MSRNSEGDNWREYIDGLLIGDILGKGLSRQSEEIQWISHRGEPIIEIRKAGRVLGHTIAYEELSDVAKEIIERARKLGYQVKLISPNVIQEGSLTREYPAIIL